MQSQTFNELIQSEKLLLVDFYADWCGPCKMMKPILEQVKAAMGDKVKIIKIDVDKNPNAAGTFQVQSIPTLILFNKGKQVWRQAGVVNANLLQQIIHQHAS